MNPGNINKHNRIEKTKPKRSYFWCIGCDSSLVYGNKCPVCGLRYKSKHQKKGSENER